MSIDISAVLIVGVLGELLTYEICDKIAESGEFQTASPWFDASREDCIHGIIIFEAGPSTELDYLAHVDALIAAFAKVSKFTGIEAKLYLSTHVS
jgi:hypothetical protein